MGFLQFMLYRAPAVLLALTLHELAHGYVALRSGDPTARDMGRLTLNPLKHLDPIGTVSMFLMGIGWAKPVPVNPRNFRNGRWDDLKVSLAGVTTNFIQFVLATLATIFISRFLYVPSLLADGGAEYLLKFGSQGHTLQLFPQYDALFAQFLRTPWLIHIQRFFFHLAMVNLGMGMFNLLPLPPLDGFHVVNDVLFSGRLQMSGKVFRIAHVALLLLLFTTNFVGRWIGAAMNFVQGGVLSVLLGVFGLR
ncbi:MAG TPA: site-2 protease family protein [Candidatus Limnocylindria bacterium]|nr:site-2 protease family protein [Candidatus Limnocylindria bacterium]